MIHIYGQGQWHGEVAIVGTKDDLVRLAKAIQSAIESKTSKIESFTNDGEGYEIYVGADSKETIDKLALPYMDVEVSGGMNPWDLFRKTTKPQINHGEKEQG